MKYDDASWHNGDGFPTHSPQEYSGTHIAIFMKWCFIKGWASESHLNEEPDDTNKVMEGKLSATEFLFKHCDGKLTDEDFNQTGNEFSSKYYGDDGLYFDDYVELFEDLMFESPESDHDFNQLSQVMESRYQSNIITKSDTQKMPLTKKQKPWWKFW